MQEKSTFREFLAKFYKKIAKFKKIMYNKLRKMCAKEVMPMKKYIVSIITVFLLITILLSVTFRVQAVGLEALDNPSLYIQQDEDNSKIVPIGNIIVWIIRTVGTAIAVLMLSIIGIKYIMGSVEEKAEYKQTMWPYILGALLIFAGASLTNIIYEIFN